MKNMYEEKKQPGILRSLDWLTIFSLDTRSGMQIVWIATSIVLGFVLIMFDDRLYDYLAYVFYALLVLLLIATIFNPHEIKGSRSWLVLGPLRLQPAEFAKFATALAISKFLSTYAVSIHNWKHFAIACGIIVLPMLCIVLQKETGSALVYLAFFLMFYREGMTGSILFTGIAMVIYFVVGIRFEEDMLWGTPTSIGKFAVLMLVQVFTAGMVYVFCKNRKLCWQIIGVSTLVAIASIIVSKYVIAFDVVFALLVLAAATIGYLVFQGLSTRLRNYYFIAAFAIGSLVFFNVADYALEHMPKHQRERIQLLLGLVEDPRGIGYNVHQSEIAIGSGGLLGKGFLNGTQTKLKYVPEQDTDFIFCTVGEEEGFIGCAFVLLMFLALILRLIRLAERQPFKFGRVYGYCVLSIFLFHVFINVGMVLGLTPVIGIPLPFFSYGGSSLWGFTLLLFIFLRIDAGRNLIRS